MISRVALLARGALLASLVAFAAMVPSFVDGAGPPPLVENDSITAAAPNGDHAHRTDTTLSIARLSSQATFAAMSQGFAAGSRGARTVGGNARSSTRTTTGILSDLPFNGGGVNNDRTSHRRPALNDRAEDTARNLRTTTTDSSGIKLVDFANILSQLLSQWSALEPNIADMDSLVTVLTSTDGAAEAEFAALSMNAQESVALRTCLMTMGFPQPNQNISATPLQTDNILQNILASPEFTHLQNLVGLLTIIVAKVLRHTADDGNDAMMQSLMVAIVHDAAVGTNTTDSQIDDFADVLKETLIEPAIDIIADNIDDNIQGGRRLQPELLLGLLDEFLLSVPQAIESALSDADLALFCVIYDSISYAATAIFRIITRIINELILLFEYQADDDDFIIKMEDINYFMSIPVRLALCGVGGLFPNNPIDLNPSDFGFCLGQNLLPLIPILFRIYIAITPSAFTTTEPGVAVTNPDYIFGEQDSETISLGLYTRNLVNSPGFYDQSCKEFEDSFDEFQDGLQRLASYEQVIVDKSFASTRFTSNVLLNEENDGCEIFNERPLKIKSGKVSKNQKCGKALKGSRRLKSSKSSKGSGGECKTRECDSFASTGVTNSLTCDAIERDDLNFLGSNCKIMTQIILDRFECDEHIKNHLFDRYCDASNLFLYNDVTVPFLTRTDGCTKENMCTDVGRNICTVHDLPILKEIFMSDGNLPKYMKDRPDVDLHDLTASLENVTAIPTMFTLRHYGSNQMPALDLIIMAISSHLTGEVNAGKQPQQSLPLILFQLLESIPGFDIGAILNSNELRGILFANGQDPLIYSLIRKFFLGEGGIDHCGPSYAVINRNSFRRFFQFNESELCDPPQQPTPVDDYASIFADIPLLADVGYKVTVLKEGTPYYDRHPYNNDHDLLSLSLSVYFGNNVVIDCYEYDDVFEYIQRTIMEPIGIDEEGWYFPGSSGSDSPILAGDAVSLTIEAIPGVIRDLLPFETEQIINDLIPNSYAVFLSDSQEYVEKYYFSNTAYSPWLGQGTCFMSSEAWTALYSDHYINGGISATTPQDYSFRDGTEHEFSTIANNPRTNWTTLGEGFNEDTTAGFFPKSVITDENGNVPDGCKAFGWGAYSSGYITVTDCPSSCQGTADERDISVSYISNQLDIFGLSFKSIYLLILANIINGLLINTGNPDELDPVDLNNISSPVEAAKIGTFLFAALGESLFGSDLPPVQMEVADTCVVNNGTLPVCDIICDYCDFEVPSVCNNPFLLNNNSPMDMALPSLGFIPSLAPLKPFIDFIGADQSINCRTTSDWLSVCSNATATYCSIIT